MTRVFMKIGEFLANPYVAGTILTLFILPLFWVIAKVMGFVQSFYREEF